jgi:cyclic-di-AMP phosphodiesterase PgpH
MKFQEIIEQVLTPGHSELAGKLLVFAVTVVTLSTTLSTVFFELVNPVPRNQGEVANYTIRAPRDFLIEDKLNSEKQRAEAAAAVPSVFTLNDNAIREVPHQLEAMFAILQEHSPDWAADKTINQEQASKARSSFEQRFHVDFVGEEWDLVLNPAMWAPLEEAVLKITTPILNRGVLATKSDFKTILKNEQKAVLVEESTNIKRELDNEHALYNLKESVDAAKIALSEAAFSRGRLFDSVVEKLVLPSLKPNVFYNAVETEKRIKEAQQRIEPIFYRIKRNEVIVRTGDVISPSQERKLKQLQEELGSGPLLYHWLSYVVLSTMVLLTIYAFTVHLWPTRRFTARDLFVGSLTLVGSFFLIKLFSIIGDSLSNTFFYFDPGTFVLATPLAAGGILLQVTIGSPAVFAFVMSFALLSGIFLTNSWIVLVLIAIGNIVGAISVRNCSRRSAFIFSGIHVAVVNVFAVLCFVTIFPEYTTAEVLNRIVWAIVGGLASGVLGAGLTPVAEFFGGYATDIKLLELASLDQPLLRDFSVQAPGTWNHCVVLGQIVEAAAEAIGANPLLARVGAYYHDIGKTTKPAYFVENQTKENRHDKLTPSMSALIVKSHVKDGIELSQKYRLPRVVIDFIPQHHGTALIKYFYERAVEEAQGGEIVEENQYRYDGPKPQSKEAAILMLGDAVEASSRTLTDPTPAKIQGLVQKIINQIFSSGELDESDLTLNDLHLIAKSFTRVLTGIYHRRVEYSEPAEKIRETKADRKTKNGISSTLEIEKVKQNGPGVQNKNGSRTPREAEGGTNTAENSAKKPDSADSKDTLKRLGI